jgi:hypothetical protein
VFGSMMMGHNTDSPPTSTAMLQPADIDRTWPAQSRCHARVFMPRMYREAVGLHVRFGRLGTIYAELYINPFTVHISHTWVKEDTVIWRIRLRNTRDGGARS